MEALNIPAVKQAGYEADDLIGTLAQKAERAGDDVVIVTGDKDMLQLVTPHIRIYDPVKDKWSGEPECVEKFGVEPARVIEIMGLMGDASDNIPGVKGIGEKRRSNSSRNSARSTNCSAASRKSPRPASKQC